jgi:hypothetical protein
MAVTCSLCRIVGLERPATTTVDGHDVCRAHELAYKAIANTIRPDTKKETA